MYVHAFCEEAVVNDEGSDASITRGDFHFLVRYDGIEPFWYGSSCHDAYGEAYADRFCIHLTGGHTSRDAEGLLATLITPVQEITRGNGITIHLGGSHHGDRYSTHYILCQDQSDCLCQGYLTWSLRDHYGADLRTSLFYGDML